MADTGAKHKKFQTEFKSLRVDSALKKDNIPDAFLFSHDDVYFLSFISTLCYEFHSKFFLSIAI